MKLETSSSDGIAGSRSSPRPHDASALSPPRRGLLSGPRGRWQGGGLVNRTLSKFRGWIFSSFGYVAGTGGGLARDFGRGKTHEGVKSERTGPARFPRSPPARQRPAQLPARRLHRPPVRGPARRGRRDRPPVQRESSLNEQMTDEFERLSQVVGKEGKISQRGRVKARPAAGNRRSARSTS